ncbi:transporter substrate-binding domain-containing protein [Actinomadura sp. NPDC049753]|uniref:transporter substrate-binding domain-containing protein n=1 Tax=Actinomadura sp. NPDC049753 TaxID=3154739 RepID=UPI0034357D6B
MNVLRHARRSDRALLLAVSAAVALTACGVTSAEDGEGPDTGAALKIDAIAVDRKAQAELPEAMKKSGTLKVASELDWPPFSYKDDSGQTTGIDVLMVQAIGRKLGLKTSIADLGADTIIPSVQNGRYDVAVSQLVTTPERLRAVNFVDYIQNTLGIIQHKDYSPQVTPGDMCGKTFVGTQGTGPLDFTRQYSEKECVAKGKPKMTIHVFDKSAATILAVGNKRGVFLTNRAVGEYVAATSGNGLVMGKETIPGSRTLSGIAYSKKQPEVGKAVQAALLSLMNDGTYQRILEKWKVTDQALKTSEIRNETGS